LIPFEPSARIQGLLGRELISTDYVALAEAIRNAYDAGARVISLTLTVRHPQRLRILDNGSGMTLPEFKKLWMTPGYSEKASAPKAGGRTPLGEKGIGRFAIDKLSKTLVVTTKHSNSEALRAEFDWTRFEDQTKKLREIKIRVQDVKDEELLGQGHGTRLELTRLRRDWTEKDWKGLRTEIRKLISPSKSSIDFTILANAAGWESGAVEPDFDGSGSYEYTFTVNKNGHVVWSLKRPQKIIDRLHEEGFKAPAVLSGMIKAANSFGFVSGRFHFFDKPAQIRKQGYDPGIGIYRDGFRVEPYGRGTDDWLGVKSLRAKRQGHAPVSPSKLFGYVEISRDKNPRLKDLTNREGIQDSQEFVAFKESMFERFDHFAKFIADDRSKLPPPATILGQRRSSTGKTRAQAFGEFADQLAHQLRQPMTHITTTVGTLQKYINKIYPEDDRVSGFVERILRNVSRLDDNIQGISDLANNLKTPSSEIDLVKLLKNLITVHKPNFDQQNVSLTFETTLTSAVAQFNKAAIDFALENYLSNALKATSNGKKQDDRAVLVRLTKARTNRLRISVEDDGDGVPKTQQENLFEKPVASSSGSGNGLYYSRLRIEQFDGIANWEPLDSGTRFYLEVPGTAEVNHE